MKEGRGECLPCARHHICALGFQRAVPPRGPAPTPPQQSLLHSRSGRPGTFIGLLSVLSVDEPVQDVVLLSEGEQDPHDLLGVGGDVQQGLHQAGLPCVRGCQLVHEEVCRQGHRMELQDGPRLRLALPAQRRVGQGVRAAAPDLRTLPHALGWPPRALVSPLSSPISRRSSSSSFAGSSFSEAP